MKRAGSRLPRGSAAAVLGASTIAVIALVAWGDRHVHAPDAATSASAVIPPPTPLPETLEATGLYADFASRTIAPENRPFSPQYPLWTDGAKKRRWIHIPKEGIDASSPDTWKFPVGTKLWKEFSFGRRVETRLIERTPSGWRFAAYVWSEDGQTTTLAPEGGMSAAEIAPGIRHRIPSRTDCRVCHVNGGAPVLGFTALQLSVDRDPNAVHAEPVPPGGVDLDALVRGGLLHGFSGSTAPRIAARTATERSALGYLHGNCGMCHRADSALSSIGMVLASSVVSPPTAPGGPIDTTIDRWSQRTPVRMRIMRREPNRSLVIERMRSRTPVLQMPPLGTQLVDEEGVRLVARWISELDSADNGGAHTDNAAGDEGRPQ